MKNRCQSQTIFSVQQQHKGTYETVAIRPNGYEKPGLLDAAGKIRDLSRRRAIGRRLLAPRDSKKLAQLKPESLPLVSGKPRLGVPYTGIGKFVAIGLNYCRPRGGVGHAQVPKRADRLHEGDDLHHRPNDDIVQPKNSTKLDWEVELGVVIGTKAQYVSEIEGARLRGGLLRRERRLGARIPARARQPMGQRQGLRHLRARSGPYLVTRDEVPIRRTSTCGST